MQERSSYGTHNVENLTEEELVSKAEALMPSLFYINLANDRINPKRYRKIADLCEILRFSHQKYPYLISLDFSDSGKVENIELIKHGHEEDSNSDMMALKSGYVSYGNFIELFGNSTILINRLRELTHLSGDAESKSNKIYITGTGDKLLAIGKPDSQFQESSEVVYKLPNRIK
jgi:hypothetical protein